MKAKRLILHLGLAKTGTTMLQESLHASRATLLERQRILYPGAEVNHWHFQTAVDAAPETLIQVRREGIVTREQAQRRAEDYLKAFAKELRQAQPETIVISSEYFASMVEPDLQAMIDLLQNHAEEIVPVLYIRDPWSYSLSLFQQYIRDGLIAAPVGFSYASGQVELIRRFETVLGNRLIVRPYLGGPARTDIISDFCAFAGVDPANVDRQSGAAANTSMGRIRTTLVAEFNSLWPQYDENKLYRHSPQRHSALTRLLEMPLDDRPMVLSQRQAEMITRQAAADIEYVERRYFAHQPIFSDLIQEVSFGSFNEIISVDSLGPEDLRHYFRATIQALQNENPGT